MNCESAIDLVVDSLIEPLDPAHATAVDEHIVICASCREEAARLRSMWQDMRAVPVPTPDAAAGVRLGRRLARARVRHSQLLRAAAILVLVGVGAIAGRLWPRATDLPGGRTAAEGTTYLLLVRGTEPDRRAAPQVLFDEYSMWAGGLAEKGRLVGGEKLDDAGRWVEGGTEGIETITGFFLIRAADYDEAEQIARTSPHIAYGGVFEIRAISP